MKWGPDPRLSAEGDVNKVGVLTPSLKQWHYNDQCQSCFFFSVHSFSNYCMCVYFSTFTWIQNHLLCDTSEMFTKHFGRILIPHFNRPPYNLILEPTNCLTRTCFWNLSLPNRTWLQELESSSAASKGLLQDKRTMFLGWECITICKSAVLSCITQC